MIWDLMAQHKDRSGEKRKKKKAITLMDHTSHQFSLNGYKKISPLFTFFPLSDFWLLKPPQENKNRISYLL